MKRSLLESLWGAGGARLLFGDAAVLVVLAAVAAAPLTFRTAAGRPAWAEVTAAGTSSTLDLARDGVDEVAGPLGVSRIEVRGGRVRILFSPCALQTCRHGGWIGEAGEMLVCLPNEVVVRLPGIRSGGPDAVAR